MILKRTRIRESKILAAANGESCANCNMQDGTVVACHSNMSVHGKGMGIKSDDIFCAFLCSKCHYMIDFGKDHSREEKEQMFYRAMSKTWRKLYELGVLKVA